MWCVIRRLFEAGAERAALRAAGELDAQQVPPLQSSAEKSIGAGRQARPSGSERSLERGSSGRCWRTRTRGSFTYSLHVERQSGLVPETAMSAMNAVIAPPEMPRLRNRLR